MIIPGFSNYDISEDGIVTNVATGNELQHRVSTLHGYYKYSQVNIAGDDGKRHTCNVLRLLALTYLKKPDMLCAVRAKDGDNTNTVLSNVEWVPYAELTRMSWLKGKMSNRRPRKSCVTEDLTDMLYDTICLYDEPVTVAELSDVLDISYSMARYGILALRQRGKVIKVIGGFEAVQ